MHRDNRLISLLLSASLIFSCTFSGCNMLAQTKESEEKKLPSKTIETTVATSTPTPSPTPTPDPNVLAKDEAIALAKEYEIP